jgi:hypothetical protein
MNPELLLPSSFIIAIMVYFSRYLIRGEFFHPGVIYAMLNGCLFLVFVFGPYTYNFKIDYSYYYMYAAIVFTYTAGTVLGSKQGQMKKVKEIFVRARQMMAVHWLLVLITTMSIFALIAGFQGSGSVLQNAVENRFNKIVSFDDTEGSNAVMFFLDNIRSGLLIIGSSLVCAYSFWHKKRYHRVFILILLLAALDILNNSRFTLLFHLSTAFIPLYIVLYEKGIISFKKLGHIIKNIKYIATVIAILLCLLVFLTNIRSSFRSEKIDKSMSIVEQFFSAEQQPYFATISEQLPIEIINPISEFSLYAGGTVAFGGVAAKIATDYDIQTWGTRTLNSLHRVIDRIGLDGDLVETARDDYFTILKKGPPGFEFAWWGDPANFIVDFGYTWSLIASAIIGWIVGWVYGRIYRSDILIECVGCVVIFNASIFTPAASPFGFFPNFLSLMILIFYILAKSASKRRKTIST